MKDIFLIISDNNKWYKLPFKDILFIKGKQSIVNELLEIEKSKYNGEYTIEHKDFKCTLTINGFGKGLKATIRDINIGNYGGFYDNDKEISLNIKFCKINQETKDYEFYNDIDFGGGKGIYEYLTHELHHAFQIYLIKNQNEILQQLDDKDKKPFKTYVEQLEACMCNDNINLDYFGFNINGILSIKPYMPMFDNNDLLKNLSNMFYYLNISEYEAFKMGSDSLDSLDNLNSQKGLFDLTNTSNQDIMIKSSKEIEKSFHQFIRRYQQNYDNIEDVVKIISGCISKLHNHKQPETRLEAEIMYDICCIAHLQKINKSFNKSQENIEQECADLLKKETKEKALEQYYNIHPLKDSIKIYEETEFCMIASNNNFIQQLTQEERKYNPKLILYFVSFNSCNNIDYATYISDELKEYCQEERQNLYNNPIYKDGIEILFGKDFWEELGMEETYIKEDIEDVEYDNYANEQDNQYNLIDISSGDTFNQKCQDFSDDELEL